MKLICYTFFCTVCTLAFIALAVYAYQHRAPEQDALARLIDRSNQELVEYKMGQLYGN